jgi:predicted porin
MKAVKLVAALMLMAGVAQAQNVSVYGVLGAGYVSGTGFGSSEADFSGLGEQLHNSNRWGVKGTEDLGNGVTAKFTLESNMSLRTGAAGKDAAGTGTNGTTLFDREANVALSSSDFGQLQLGRGKNFLYQVADEFDSRSNWNFGGLKPIARYAGFYSGSGVSRFDNMIRYTSPEIKGFRADYAYSFGNQLGDSEYKSSYNAGVRWTHGPFDVAYTHEEARLSNAVVSEYIDLVAVKYNVTDALTVNVGYAITDNPSTLTAYRASSTKADGKTDAHTWFAGAKYKVNDRVSVNGGYYNVQDRVTAGKDDVTMYAVGAIYSFSKRTEVFADYVVANRGSSAAAPFTIYDRWVPNGDGSTFADSKFNQSAVAVGIQHRF